eukprot:c45555_g1_i1.p1 GENE.c45555_g1_i1~~c45555_g1_i1.p1  ORF type:complete len:440 (+),score=111.61 c45555_g1_i1:72-1391(+)
MGPGMAEQLIHRLSDGIVVSDKDGRIIDYNPSFCLMFGYEPGELVGDTINRLMPGKIAGQHHKFLEGFINRVATLGDPSQSFRMAKYRELQGLRKDGTLFPVEINIDSTTAPDSSELRLLATIRDITERVEKQAQEIAEQAERERMLTADKMLGYVSHEIRNPLNGMRAMVDVLVERFSGITQATETPSLLLLQQVHEDLKNIRTLSEMMEHIVDDTLELRKIAEGGLRISYEMVDINRVIRVGCNLLQPKLAAKDARVKMKLGLLPDNPVLAIDPHRITQVLFNLLSNADAKQSNIHRSGTETSIRTSSPSPDRYSVADPSKRYLVVDDLSLNRTVLVRILGLFGAVDVTEAANGAEAVALAKEQHFDVVLMDLIMPEMNGVQAALALRQAGFQGKILGVSGDTGLEGERAMQVGMDLVLRKPVSVRKLSRVFRAWCL